MTCNTKEPKWEVKTPTKVTCYRHFVDDRGSLWEILRTDEEHCQGIAQAYISTIAPGVVKGYHLHKKQTDQIHCIKGKIKVLCIQDPNNEKPKEIILSDQKKELLIIPPGWLHGWTNIGTEEALVLNLSNKIYDPNDPDEERLSWDTCGEDVWRIRNQ